MIRYNLRYAQNYGLIALFLVITLSCYAKSGESGGPKRTFVTLRRTDNGIGVYVSAEFMKRSDNKYIVPIVVMPREPKGVYSTLAVTFQAINVARQMDSYRSVESFYILTLCIVVIFSFVAVISSQKSNRTLDGYFLVLSPCIAGVILFLFIFRPHVPQYIIIGSQYDPTEIMNFAMTEQIGYGYFNCNVTVARPDADEDTEDTILISLCYNAIGKNVEDIKICTPKMQGEFQLVVEGSWKCRELEKYFDSNLTINKYIEIDERFANKREWGFLYRPVTQFSMYLRRDDAIIFNVTKKDPMMLKAAFKQFLGENNFYRYYGSIYYLPGFAWIILSIGITSIFSRICLPPKSGCWLIGFGSIFTPIGMYFFARKFVYRNNYILMFNSMTTSEFQFFGFTSFFQMIIWIPFSWIVLQ